VTACERTARFLDLSVRLTAFAVFDLHGTGQVEPYLATVEAATGEDALDELLAAYERLLGESRQDGSAVDGLLRREILADAKLGPIARNIIKLWYIGTWYELPSAWRESFGTREQDFTHVVSPAAYTEGLLWPAIGANPNGAKAPGYGSWAQPPRIPADVV
jgi:hypothetical protein